MRIPSFCSRRQTGATDSSEVCSRAARGQPCAPCAAHQACDIVTGKHTPVNTDVLDRGAIYARCAVPLPDLERNGRANCIFQRVCFDIGILGHAVDPARRQVRQLDPDQQIDLEIAGLVHCEVAQARENFFEIG